MNQTEDIKELVAALSKAQSVMKPAVFNRINPHFRNRYADFTSCMDACRMPLSENGLAVIQFCETIDGKLNLVTMLAHTSGQWMRSEFPIISAKMDSQGIGSAMTYAKRYSLCGMVGIVADEESDDDAEAAVGRYRQPEAAKAPIKPYVKPLDIGPAEQEKKLVSVEQAEELRALLKKCPEDYVEKVTSGLLRMKPSIEKLEDLPLDLYEKAKTAAIKNAKAKSTMEPSREVING